MSRSVPHEPPTRAASRAQHARRGAAQPTEPSAPVARPRPLVTVGVVGGGLVLAAAAATGEPLVEVAAVVLAGLVVAVGWPRLVGSSTPAGSAVVLVVTVVALGGALLARDTEPRLEHVPAAVAVGIIAMCLHPLVQASAREDLAPGLARTALGVLVIASGGVLTSAIPHGVSPVVIAGIALSVAALADLLTERPALLAWMLPIGMLVGGVAAVLAHLLLTGGASPWSALVGVLGAGTALALRRVMSQRPEVDGVPGAIACGVASVLLVGPLLHLISRLPLG